MMAKDECTLCNELFGISDLALWPRIAETEVPSRIICQNESCVALVTIGPIVNGHCLIIPRSHLKSMAAVDGPQQQRAKAMLECVSDSLRLMYGTNVLLFEHGAKEGSNCKPCSVGHAHWHVVPTNFRTKDMLIDEYSWKRVSGPFINRNCDYLLVGDAKKEYWATYLHERVPSQVLRMRLAFCAGRPKTWDWRTVPAIEQMVETITDFQNNRAELNGIYKKLALSS